MSMATGTAKTSLDDLRKIVSLGRDPDFKDQPSNDQLFEMVLALAAEVSVLRDRLDTHERLAADGKPATPSMIESYETPAAVMSARSDMRQSLLKKVFRPIRQAAARQMLDAANKEV